MSEISSDKFIDFSANLRLQPELEGSLYCHVPFQKMFSSSTDLRDIIRGLEGHKIALTPDNVIIDSDMALHEAFRGISKDCPPEILAEQQLLRVFYFDVNQVLHHGQIVVHSLVVEEVLSLFAMALKEKLPLGSVIPVSDSKFERNGCWDDYLSMEQNNASSFNFRRVISATGERKRLSLHALGLAVDINPLWNPCYGAPAIHCKEGYSAEAAAGYGAKVPTNGNYDLSHPGSFHNRHPVVLFMQELGWTWGGEWGDPKDLHHFQKIPENIKDQVTKLRG